MKKKVKVLSKKKMHTKKEEKLEIHNEENIDNGRIKWSLQIVDINKLKPYEKNPRIITEEALLELENSFNEIGMCQPLVVSNDFSIISGNARYLQLKKEGCDKVQVMIPDRKLTERQEKAVVIRMNKTNVGKWDFDSLANNYEIIDLMDWGFTTEELVGVEEEKIEGKCDEDEVPEVKDTVTKRGDIWLVGKHRVMCGDSTMIDDVEKLMKGEKFSLMITDLPYGVSYADKNEFLNAFDRGNRNHQKEIKNDHISSEQLLEFATQVYTNMSLYCEKKNAYYAFMPQGGEQMIMMMMALKESGFQVKHELIWVKNHHVIGRVDYAYKHEPICYGWSQNGTHEFYGDFQTSIFEFNKLNSSKLHPTMKPIELIEKLIENSSKKNEVAIDPTSGSGSTLIACEKTNRKCYGMELDEYYVDVICQRWMNFTGRKDCILESTGQTYEEVRNERMP